MPTYTVVKARNAGEKDNPHGGKLVKWYLVLEGAPSGNAEVYCQKKPGNDLAPGDTTSGRMENGEYGWRLFPETDQRPDGGNFQRPAYKVLPDTSHDDQRWSIERQVAAKCAAEVLKELSPEEVLAHVDAVVDAFHIAIQRPPPTLQLDADVGSGQAAHGASEPRPPVDEDAVDLSADPEYVEAVGRQEASPAQKGKLTQMFHAAGLSREAMQAVVLFRCGSEKATKAGASQLITDLQEGATHDALLAEIWDAKRAGNPLGARAAALIPSEVPMDTEGLPGDDGSLPEVPQKDEENVPF